MDYILIAAVGFVGGAICIYVILEKKRRELGAQQVQQEAQSERFRHTAETLSSKTHELDARARELDAKVVQLEEKRKEFDARHVSYNELQDENAILKRDLSNMDIESRKVQLDSSKRDSEHKTLAERVNDLGGRYVAETVKWVSATLNPNNFTACKQRLQNVIERCRAAGFVISTAREDELVAQLKSEYQAVVRIAFQREEQARIKAQIREEQLREKEVERELKQLEHEREAIKAALEKALAKADNQHSEEVERLKTRLAEAEAKAQRAISQAQLTKSGHVYVISNVGSFGDGVFKVGMTRRLEPLDRIHELGSASVPFPFDVHMMISCEDAPTLENALHRKLFKHKVNRTNPRKEFFRTDIQTICSIVQEHHGEVEFVAEPEALQYRESLSMPDDDQEFVEGIFGSLEDEDHIPAEEV